MESRELFEGEVGRERPEVEDLPEKLRTLRNHNFSWTVEGPALGHIINCHEVMKEAEGAIERLRSVLGAIDHTLTAHGHMDADTPLHERITEALKNT